MTVAQTITMTADEFLAWSMSQPDGRYELFDGEVVRMASEQAGHARAKFAVLKAFDAAIAAAGLPCEAFPDGMAVRVGDRTVFEPDASVRCGPPLPDEALTFDDPVIVAEVLSPSTGAVDVSRKFDGYFRLPALRHYLVIDHEARSLIHHRRGAGAEVLSAVLRDGLLTLDPPGLDVDVAALFPAAPAA